MNRRGFFQFLPCFAVGFLEPKAQPKKLELIPACKSFCINTTYNLEQVFDLGQIAPINESKPTTELTIEFGNGAILEAEIVNKTWRQNK